MAIQKKKKKNRHYNTYRVDLLYRDTNRIVFFFINTSYTRTIYVSIVIQFTLNR